MAKKQKHSVGTILLIILVIILTAGLAGLFFATRKKEEEQTETKPAQLPAQKQAVRNDDFPLKKLSSGNRVKQLQEALTKKFGASILPKYGIDSDFGTETETALISKGYPAVIDSETFNKIIAEANKPATTTSVIDYKGLSARLRTAFEYPGGTDNATVRDLLLPSRNAVYLKTLRDTYNSLYNPETLVARLTSEQELNEFQDIINRLNVL